MNFLSLFHAGKILICVLYSVAAAVLAFDTVKTCKKDDVQWFRRRMLALFFGAFGAFYLSNLVGYHLFPQFFTEENYVGVFLILSLSVFPMLLYLLYKNFRQNVFISKTSYIMMMALLVCLTAGYVIGAVISRQGIATLQTRYFIGLICVGQMSFQVWIRYKLERRLKRAGYFDKYTKIYVYAFMLMGFAMFPVFFLLPDSMYWLMLQFIMWIGHGCLFFYVLKRDLMIGHVPVYLSPPRPFGLLGEASSVYHHVAEDSVYGDLYERLVSYFEKEKPYLKSGINVADVAAYLYTNKTYLSRLLNERLNQNFCQFVNAYRIKEAQRLVAEEGAIALQELCKRVGFTSMATFTVAFKLNTGMTPGEWCKKQTRLP